MEQDILDLFNYVSIGDKEVPDRKLPLYFESPNSVSSSYGYKAHGKFFYHTGEDLIGRMVHTIAAGGNYLLNNGPMGNGGDLPRDRRKGRVWSGRRCSDVHTAISASGPI